MQEKRPEDRREGQQERPRQQSWAEEALGIKKPRSFIVDPSILDDIDLHKVIREDIQKNRIEYEFPEGFNTLDLFEECRALTLLDDFEAMYDVTMQMIVGKSVVIRLFNYNEVKTELCRFQVVDKNQNLRAIAAIDEYPCLILWLTELIGGLLLKKYPTPLADALPKPETAQKDNKEQKKKPRLGRRDKNDIH
jgi:hypothetical protein